MLVDMPTIPVLCFILQELPRPWLALLLVDACFWFEIAFQMAGLRAYFFDERRAHIRKVCPTDPHHIRKVRMDGPRHRKVPYQEGAEPSLCRRPSIAI